MRETTALGAINQKNRVVFEPEVTPEEGEKMFKKWDRAVNMCRGWLDVDEVTER
jgi:glycerol kinase